MRPKSNLSKKIVLVLLLVIQGIPFIQSIAQDLIITNHRIFSDTTILLSGNLLIKSGGILEFNKVNLRMNCLTQGQYKIEVEPGGEMSITNNSSISAVNPDNPFAFTTRGKKFIMTNSALSGVGWGNMGEDMGNDEEKQNGEKGLFIGTDSALIDNNTFSENYCGIILADTSITFSNNNVHSNIVHGIYIRQGYDCQVFGNEIEHGEDGVGSATIRLAPAHNNTFKDNIIKSNIHTGIIEAMGSNGNKFENNTITGFGVGIILMFLTNDNVVIDNDISTDEAGIMVWGWNNTVDNNIVSDREFTNYTGIYMVYSYNSTVSNNRLINVTDEHGIYMRHSSNNKLINNQITCHPSYNSRNMGTSSGILLFRNCKHNIIQSNIVSGFPEGISLFFESDSNFLADNQISNSNYYGLILENSSSNYIFSNNTFSENGNPYYSNSANFFDYSGQVPADNMASHPAEVTSTDWIIDGHLQLSGQEVFFSSAHIPSGDTLTLTDMTLYTGRTTRDVSGLVVENGGTLIMNNCRFIHDLHGNGFIFSSEEGGKLIMKNCLFKDCGQEWPYGGIKIYSDNFTMENNTFYGTIITLFHPNNGLFSGNKIYDGYTGLSLSNAENITVTDNIITGTVRDGIIGGGNNIQIRNNVLKNNWGGGIFLSGAQNSIIEENNVSFSFQPYAGIDFWGEKLIAQNNDVTNSYIGFNNGGNNGIALNNRISDCIQGMEMTETTRVEDNIITNCQSGIGGDSLINNKVSNCKIGIGGNVLSGNEIDSCEVGIYQLYNVAKASGNIIRRCDTGVFLENSGNVFYHNEMIGNKIQAYDNIPEANSWDYNGSGNFWSDYAGPDNNGDGIGDIPYIILPIENKDNFPLLEPKQTTHNPIFLNVNPKSLSPTSFNQGDVNIALASLQLSTESMDSTFPCVWSGLQIVKTGSGNDYDIESVKIWKDSDNNEILNPESDSMIGEGQFTDTMALIIFDQPENITIDTSGYLISLDIAQNIDKTNITIGIALPDSTCFICPYPVIASGKNLPFRSNQLMVPNNEVLNPMVNFVCFPNPFNKKITVQFSLPQYDHVLIQVINVNGQIVHTLINSDMQQGEHSLVWNVKNGSENNMKSGIFYVKLITTKMITTKKVVLIE